MDKKIQKAIKNNPEVDVEFLTEALQDAETQHALKAIADQKGGQILIAEFSKDIESFTNLLAENYREYSRDDFVAISAGISAASKVKRLLLSASGELATINEAIEETLR